MLLHVKKAINIQCEAYLLLFFFFSENECSQKIACILGSNYWRNRVLMVAKDFKRKAHFAVSNEDEFSSVSIAVRRFFDLICEVICNDGFVRCFECSLLFLGTGRVRFNRP